MTPADFSLPISRVKLAGFKGVLSANVSLRPLSVVVGRNSAGKSSLLQSVLLMSQAARADQSPGLINLNGELVRLGTFNEVKNFRMSDDSRIQIGLATNVEFDYGLRGLLESDSAEVENDGAIIEGFEIALDAELERAVSESRVWLHEIHVLARARMAFEDPKAQDDERFVVTELSVVSPRNATEEPLDDWTPNQITIRDFAFSADRQRVDSADVVNLSGFVPWKIEKFGNLQDLLLQAWWDAYSETLSDEIRDAKFDYSQQREDDAARPRALSNRAVKQAWKDVEYAYQRWEARNNTSAPVRDFGFDDVEELTALVVARAHRGLKESSRTSIAKSMVELGEREFKDRFDAVAPSTDDPERVRLYSLLEGQMELPLEPRGRHLIDVGTAQFLQALQNVHYLGPIRRPSTEPGSSSADIGPSGEYSSSVLRERAQDMVTVPVPIEYMWGTEWSVREVSVADALNDILSFLDLATSAGVSDHGRHGIGFSVVPTTSAGHQVDLTAVGVGVSQALPVALQLVLSRPGDVLIIEQPELHLHPAMQLRMADLLLKFATAGRQIIVETHSEHLVNRLRRRVVEDPSALSAVVSLLFAETDDDDNTVYRESNIRDDGTLADDWPDGFFDVGASEATELLRALLKRQQETGQ